MISIKEIILTVRYPAAMKSAAQPEPRVVDIRPLCAAGDPPLSTILDAADQLKPRQSLRLIAPFEPTPLYALLGGRGLMPNPSLQPDGSWQIDFNPADCP